ncbi:MAG: hypothetical protein JO079_11280, partial [Frankiaceae bacterium]|nr:hypothetical protein [Frankiaceae bacterium]
MRADLTYPPARRDPTADVLHGETVLDPYRWLEDTYADDTAAWVRAQNTLTEQVLAGATSREQTRARLTEVWNYPRRGVPYERAGRWFQQRNSGLLPQSVLYVMDGPDDEGRVLIDPNALSADGTVALMGTVVSPDGKLLAYATSAAGSDWMTWRIREIDSGAALADELGWSKFSGAVWTPDSASLLYALYDEPDEGQEFLAESRVGRIVRHRLGTPQSDDVTVWSAPDQPEWIPSVSPTPDDAWAVVFVAHGSYPENQLHVIDLADPEAPARPLVPELDCEATYAGNVGSTFYLVTDAGAARRRLVAVDLDNSARDEWR